MFSISFIFLKLIDKAMKKSKKHLRVEKLAGRFTNKPTI